MATYYRGRGVVCVTFALLLAVAAAPAADAVSAESQPSRGPARAPATCVADEPVARAPGYENLYTHYADAVSGCSVVTNTGSLPLLFWSDHGGRIDAPVRSGWVAETTAEQIRGWVSPGRVVVLPGESAVLYDPPPWYTVDGVPLHVAQQAQFTATYARLAQAARDVGESVPLNNRLGFAIKECSEAASETWNDLGQGTGVETLADIFDRAKGFNSCRTAYDIINPSSTSPDTFPGWEQWHQRATDINLGWRNQAGRLAARAARVLQAVR
ncbi:hypothetical protein [Streptomyces coeruleorubidus]|uniref:hypothetical protein n=1 Tax=Streptomyces coeruleorubidus TaxID=116188 RepID=UPI00367ABEF1